MATFNTLTIDSIRPQPDSVAVSFVVPDELRSDYQFLPGQYLTLRADIDGDDIRRSYSICSHHHARTLEVGIKRVEDGRFSNFASKLKTGDSLQVMTPEGRFTAEIGGQHNFLLIAAGSGITPCLSIAKSVLQDEPNSTITLLYGNHDTSTIMFRDDIDNLKNLYTERFMLTHLLSSEKQDADILNGRISAEKLKSFDESNLLDFATFDAIYICGPQEMTDNCKQGLQELGVSKDQIKFELFTAADSISRKSTKPKRRLDENDTGTPVTVIFDGAERLVQVKDETVLEAAQRAGLDLPFSCAGGMCCTCRCKVMSGKTAMDLNFSLADWEIEAGFTLACQTRPTTDNVVLDFDNT